MAFYYNYNTSNVDQSFHGNSIFIENVFAQLAFNSSQKDNVFNINFQASTTGAHYEMVIFQQ